MIHSALRIGRIARAQRQRQQQQQQQQAQARRRHHHHNHKQQRVEPELGPYDIWEVGEDSEWGPPPRWVTRFSSAEERDVYLTEKRARRQAECERIAAYWRRIDEENARRDAYEAQLIAEMGQTETVSEDDNDEYAPEEDGCFTRIYKRIQKWCSFQ